MLRRGFATPGQPYPTGLTERPVLPPQPRLVSSPAGVSVAIEDYQVARSELMRPAV